MMADAEATVSDHRSVTGEGYFEDMLVAPRILCDSVASSDNRDEED